MDLSHLETAMVAMGTQFVETESDSALFEMTFDIQALYGEQDDELMLEGGESIEVTYEDYFEEEELDDIASIGGAVGELMLDKTSYFVPNLDLEMVVHITLEDVDANQNEAMEDEADVWLVVLNAEGENLCFDEDIDALPGDIDQVFDVDGVDWPAVPVTLEESGLDTDTFEGDVTFEWNTDEDRVIVDVNQNYALRNYDEDDREAMTSLALHEDLVGGRIKLYWEDPLSTDDKDYDNDGDDEDVVEATASVRADTAILTVSDTAPSMGDIITVLLTHKGSNIDSDEEDEVTVTILVDDDDSGQTLDLDETGEDTNEFEGEFEIGEDDPAWDDVEFAIVAGEDVTFEWDDDVTSASTHEEGLVDETLEADLSVASHTAMLTFDSDLYSPFATVTITLWDPDLILHDDDSEELGLARVNSETDRSGQRDLMPDSKEDDGSFTYEVNLWVEDIPEDVAPPDEAPVEVDNEDMIFAYFVDEANDDGDDETVWAEADVLSTSGLVEITPSMVDVGDTFTITIDDVDANREPDIEETLTVVAKSDSWPQGQNVVLEETGEDTHIFTGEVFVEDEIPSGNEVWADVFDTITVEYTDEYDADGEEDTVFSATIRVGIIPDFPVPASEPEFVDAQGMPVTVIRTGELIVIQSTITNAGPIDQNFAYLVQIQDDAGVVVQLSFVLGTLEPGESLTPGVSWIPDERGDYTVQVFVWESLTVPEALSEVQIEAASVQ
jgi:hypothetical protein